MQVNAIITATTTANKDIKTTISYLRESQEDKAKQLAIALNALTTNTYKSTQVNEINIIKTEPTLTLSPWQTSASEYIYTINYSGDGNLFVNCTKPAQINSEKTRLSISVGSSSDTFSGTIFATETNNYYSTTKTFSKG